MLERSPFPDFVQYRPDVAGVTKARRVMEIEVKISRADFRKDREKRIVEWRARGLCPYVPAQFYFIVPPDLVPCVMEEAPAEAGVLTITDRVRFGTRVVECVRGSKLDPRATTLSLRDIVRAVQHQSGTLQRLANALAKMPPGENSVDKVTTPPA